MTGVMKYFDLETCSAAELYGSNSPGPFVRLVGESTESGVRLSSSVDSLLTAAAHGETLCGHNILGFDLIALAVHHGLDFVDLADKGQLYDTMIAAVLADPPPARIPGERAKALYKLDSLGQQFFGTGKSLDLKALAKKFGGYGNIPIDDEFRFYCARDVSLTRRLADRYGPLDEYGVREHRVAARAAQMSLQGFRVDVQLLNQRISDGREFRTEKMAQAEKRYGISTSLATRSALEKLGVAFEKIGVVLPARKDGMPQLGKAVLQQVLKDHADNPEAVELAGLVLGVNGIRTVYQTVADNLVGDRVHPGVSMMQASGRWSTTKPGLTVFGKREGKVRERAVFLPDAGDVILCVDLAQIDARAVAALAQDENYLAMFEPGKDLHTEVALAVWGDASRRQDAKAVGHGFNYGLGANGLARQTGLDPQTCSKLLADLARRFPGVRRWQRRLRADTEARREHLVENGFGRLMRCDADRIYTQAPGLAGQGAARDLMMEGILRLDRRLLGMLRGVIHDELVLSVPAGELEDVRAGVLDALQFEWAPSGTPVPIVADAKNVGRNWAAAYEKETS